MISLHGAKGPFWDPKPLRKDAFPICRACDLLCSNSLTSASGTAVRCHTELGEVPLTSLLHAVSIHGEKQYQEAILQVMCVWYTFN